MCMVGDDDYWDWYTEKTVKCRKPFTCTECGRPVPKGESYRLQGGVHDGSFDWNKTCLHCDEASEWLRIVCEGFIFTQREEDFLSHVVGYEKDIRSRPLVRLVRWMRADWRNRQGELRPIEAVSALTTEAIDAYNEEFRRRTAA